MRVLFVVDRPTDWSLAIPGVEVVESRRYVEDASYSHLSYSLVFNLSRSYGYQRLGYYVSLLAEARGHRAWPSIETINDDAVKYLNRLSDWFFVAGRIANDDGAADVLWVPGANR